MTSLPLTPLSPTALAITSPAVERASSTRYVASDGNDVSDGRSVGAPFATIQKAHDDLGSAGGRIVLGRGTFTEVPVLSYPIILSGSGRNVTTLQTGSSTADLLTLSGDHIVVEHMTIKNTLAGGAPSAGAGVRITTGFGCVVQRCRISSMFYGIQIDDPAYNVEISGNYIVNFYSNGITRPYGGQFGDRGDDTFFGNTMDTGVAIAGSSCIFLGAHGGAKIESNKLLHADYGVDLQVADGAATSVLVVDGNSLEAQAVANIRLGRAGTTGTYGYIVISDNEFSISSLTNVTIGNNLFNIPISGNTFHNGSSGIGVDVTGNSLDVSVTGNSFDICNIGVRFQSLAQQPFLGPNSFQGVTTPFSDQTPQTQTQAAPQYKREARAISVASSSIYTNVYQIDMNAFRFCHIRLVCDFVVQGVGNSGGVLERVISRGASGNAVITTRGTDSLVGATFDVQFDITTTAGSVLIGFRRNNAGGGTSLDGIVSLIVDGHTSHITRL